MKKILVTGGSGFIGTHLCNKLIANGYDVTSFDLKPPKIDVRCIQGDVRNSVLLNSALKDCDAVFHFAATVSIPLCQEDPTESFRNNLIATTQIAQAIIEKKKNTGQITRLLFASSASVYGMNGKPGVSIKEEDVAQYPLSHYAAQKLCSEHALKVFYETEKLPSVIFRFFNVFGSGQDPKSPYSGVITIFQELIRAGKDLTIFGDGSFTRDFIYIDDLTEAFISALKIDTSKCNAEPMNLGTGIPTTINDIAKTLIEQSGKKLNIHHREERVGDVPHSRASIDRAKNILNWKPVDTLASGLKKWKN